MRLAFFLLSFLIVTTPAVAQRQSVGIFFGWGAFEEPDPRKCFAIAQPAGRSRALGAFATVGFWPDRNAGSQLHIRLSREKRRGSAIILKIDGRSFQLIGGSANAWAPNPRADAEIVAAMRTGVTMNVETRSTSGARIRDRYALRGAASAIDAAAIACAR